MSQGTVLNNLNVGMVTKWAGTLLYGSKWSFMSPLDTQKHISFVL